MDIERLKNYVVQYYKKKDVMHDLKHVKRVLKMSKKLKSYKEEKIDENLILYGAYFHGCIKEYEYKIKFFLFDLGLETDYIDQIVKVTKESLKENEAETLEGKILHDAHMIEGGTYFLLIKSLITGSVRKQNLEDTINTLKIMY